MLKVMVIEECPNINDYNELANVNALEELNLINCKGISSLKFIENLPSLVKLVMLGNTDVLDGDLTLAKHVKEVIYKHRSHYNIVIQNEEYESLLKRNAAILKGKF